MVTDDLLYRGHTDRPRGFDDAAVTWHVPDQTIRRPDGDRYTGFS